MRAVIIAAGTGSRWNNHLALPKHLAPVRGEPIIHRTQRQLRELGVLDVRVVTTDHRYATTGTLEAPRGFESLSRGAKKFLDSRHLWNTQGRTLVVYGDVCFTHDAMRAVVGYRGVEWTLFARLTESTFDAERNAECFAQSFHPHGIPEHEAALEKLAHLEATRRVSRSGGWEHYALMTGAKLTRKGARPPQVDRGRLVVIDDATDDIDTPADYQRLLTRF